jgi:hypothetical protein
MTDNNGGLKWALTIALLLLIGMIFWSKDALMAAWAKWFGKTTPPPTNGGNGTTPPPQFPVCLNSSNADIKAAFIASGMMDAYKASLAAGSYDGRTWAELEAAIFADPHGWLEIHPYLYNAYPAYFIAP